MFHDNWHQAATRQYATKADGQVFVPIFEGNTMTIKNRSPLGELIVSGDGTSGYYPITEEGKSKQLSLVETYRRLAEIPQSSHPELCYSSWSQSRNRRNGNVSRLLGLLREIGRNPTDVRDWIGWPFPDFVDEAKWNGKTLELIYDGFGRRILEEYRYDIQEWKSLFEGNGLIFILRLWTKEELEAQRIARRAEQYEYDMFSDPEFRADVARDTYIYESARLRGK